MPDLLLFIVDNVHASTAVHAIERGDTRVFIRKLANKGKLYGDELRRNKVEVLWNMMHFNK
jgi:hypothetical protein